MKRLDWIRKERGETVKYFVPVTVFRRATRSRPRVGNGGQTGGILLPIKTIATSEAFQRETWPEGLPTPYSVKIRFCWPLIGVLGVCSLLSTNKCTEMTTGVFLYPLLDYDIKGPIHVQVQSRTWLTSLAWIWILHTHDSKPNLNRSRKYKSIKGGCCWCVGWVRCV